MSKHCWVISLFLSNFIWYMVSSLNTERKVSKVRVPGFESIGYMILRVPGYVVSLYPYFEFELQLYLHLQYNVSVAQQSHSVVVVAITIIPKPRLPKRMIIMIMISIIQFRYNN